MAVRFSPVAYKLRPAEAAAAQQEAAEGGTAGAGAAGPFGALPYRMVFAVATLDSVAIYDTQVRRTLIVIKPLKMGLR